MVHTHRNYNYRIRKYVPERTDAKPEGMRQNQKKRNMSKTLLSWKKRRPWLDSYRKSQIYYNAAINTAFMCGYFMGRKDQRDGVKY